MKQSPQQNIWISEEDYPSTLNVTDLHDPFRVVDDFFRTYSLPQAKQYLWQTIKFHLVDITTPSTEMRPIYYRFLLELERVVDAAWVMKEYGLIQKIIGQQLFSKDTLKKWRNVDLISFLSPYESANPRKALTDFFLYQSLGRWKVSYLEGLRKTILDPMYFLLFGCYTLEEFVKFSKVSKLLEGLFLIRVQNGYTINCLTEFDIEGWNDNNNVDSNMWLKDYTSQNDSFTSVQHFANICYAHRFHHEWNNYNIHKIFENYETILKLTHATIDVLDTYPVSSLPKHGQKIVRQCKSWSTGRITRFISGLLLTSRTFAKGYKAYTPPQNEIDHITRLIYLAHEISKI